MFTLLKQIQNSGQPGGMFIGVFLSVRWEDTNQYDLGMEFPVRLKLLIQLKTVMTREQLTKLDHAVQNGELKTTRFTAEEFRDVVNRFVAHRLAKRMRGLNKK